MYPLPNDRLTFAAVAHHWRRFVEGSPTAEELSDLLLAGFWRGELILRGGNGAMPLVCEAALGALRDTIVGAQGIDQVAVDLAFWAEDEEGELGPCERWQSDGGVEVDLRTRVRLPATPEDWTGEILEAAFAALAGVSLKRLPFNFRVGVDAQQVLKADFARYCDLNGYFRPAFWFGPGEGRVVPASLNHTILGFQRWFAKQIVGPKLRSKTEYCRLARETFPGLSAKQFHEEWDRSAPDSWKMRGRRSSQAAKG
jgi:hypothetical protein